MKELTQKQKDVLIEAGSYYLQDATQYGNVGGNYYRDICGLNPKDPRYNLLKSAINKLKTKTRGCASSHR